MRRIVWVACALALVACARTQKKPVVQAEPPPAPAPIAQPAPAPAPAPVVAAPAVPAPRACAGDEGCARRELCVNGTCSRATLELAECRPVAHFEFDRSDLGADDLALLRRGARCLLADPTVQVTFEGHCDERGTSEYNLLLGDRRAHAVRTYMEKLGVPRGQMFTVSYGKERPLCLEQEESCWSRNRRTATVPGEPTSWEPAQALRTIGAPDEVAER